MGIKQPRKYTAEFKERAVRLAEEIGPTRAAEKLGVSDANIHNWRAKKRSGEKFKDSTGTPQSVLETPEEEIKRLRRENDELKKANYILKRAAAFFSQDHLK